MPPEDKTATEAGGNETAIKSAAELLLLEKRLREQAAVGAVYDACIHNCTIHRSRPGSRPACDRDTWTADWLAELHGFSNQRLEDGRAFGTDTLMTGGRVHAIHSGENHFGPATGKRVHYRALTAARAAGGRLIELWQFTDNLHLARQLGISPQALAQRLAGTEGDNLPCWDLGEADAGRSQTGPDTAALDAPGLAGWLTAINGRRFDKLAAHYCKDARVYGPGARQLDGPAALVRFWLSVTAALPDCRLQVRLSTTAGDSGQSGMVWSLCGRHTGPGLTAPPSGERLRLQGISQWQLHEGRIRKEWLLFDEIDLLVQICRRRQRPKNRL
ncbi:ester cyclase [Exilibacterium tricleocarpae]|uniref:Ester cyclase n=1 Tax=Exilibacterium tricleocarpae TaxID=2591008 RepID=A0A545TVK9_9GAMM|nr:ester cyclase [Exilibacterium tricleocarpae]TQV81191.1 ester cyclase [Exilibacterium tricleocarpae]